MPDITATRPSAGAPIETAWGDAVHDMLEGIQAGQASATFSSSTATATVNVTFPRPYATPPIVVCAAYTSSGLWAVVFGVTTTIAQFQCRTPSAITGTFQFNWIAIGTPA